MKELFFSFQGRIGRLTYWVANLFPLGVSFIGSFLAEKEGLITLVIAAISAVVVVWSALALQVKRWHDRDKSGWWVLLGLIPIINIWVFIETGFFRGTEGSNRFGDDPLNQ